MFADGLATTVARYRDNRPRWEKIKSGEFRRYDEEQYRDLGDPDILH